MKKPSVYIYDPRIDFRNIYALNLIVYIDASVHTFSDMESLIAEVKIKTPDAVFMYLSIEEEDKLFHYTHEIKAVPKKPVSIVVAKKRGTQKDIIYHESIIPVRELIQVIAKDMGITAKYMSTLNFGEFYPIPLGFILPGWQMIQTIYTKSDTNSMIPFLYEGEFLKDSDIKRASGVDVVYCKSNDRLELVNSFTSGIKELLESKKLNSQERLIHTDTAFSMISTAITRVGLPETTRDLVKTTVHSMETIIKEVPTLSKLYELLAENSTSLRYKHSLICCHIGQYLLAREPWSSKQHFDQWTYLCFFHDIFLEDDSWLFFDTDDSVNKSNLTSREKSIILNHARLSAQIVSQCKELPVGIDVLIKQHHGSKMGDSLSKISMSISQTCVYFILVEEYVSFLLSENERLKSTEEIYNHIEKLFKKYPFPNYKKFIPILRTIPIN